MHPADCACLATACPQVADFDKMHSLNKDDPHTWAPLSHLTGLTSLVVGSGLGCCLPAQLAMCTALLELEICDELRFGDGNSEPTNAWAPLRHLTALTKFKGPCRPAALALLPTSLLDLCATCSLAAATQAEMAPISRLTALTRLDLSRAKLHLFPAALSKCGALRELLLRNAQFLDLPEAAFQPLAHLTALSSLDLREAQLAAVPPALAAATALVDLCGSKGPPSEGPAGEVQHLSRLSSLTKLRVHRLGLLRL